MSLAKLAVSALAATFMTATVALADGRAPNEAEKAAVGEALTKAGFSTWGKVEFDDGKWEIDNAVASDGKRYDVDLAATDLKVIKKELDVD